MPIQSALEFIARARADQELQQALQRLGADADLSALTDLGARLGFDFSVEELRRAHAHDWSMRWMHFRREAEEASQG